MPNATATREFRGEPPMRVCTVDRYGTVTEQHGATGPREPVVVSR